MSVSSVTIYTIALHGTTCHKGIEMSSGKNDYNHHIYKPQDTHKVFKNI